MREEIGMDRKINIIEDLDGKKIVVINDIRFKGKDKFEWKEVEEMLKEYVGEHQEIIDTCEVVYIGKDFPDEYVHGKDKTVLRGPNLKAKANASLAVKELISIASNKSDISIDYNKKHGKKAQNGWYRYDTRLALPVYDNDNDLIRYNIYKLRMLVRSEETGKLFIYDFLRTKKEKETNSPL